MNHTQNYNLNQWEASDQLRRVDVNADNAKIDAAIKAVAQTAAGKGNCCIAYGSYTGTGKYGQDNPNTLTFPFQPQIIVVAILSASGFCDYLMLLRGQTDAAFIGNNGFSSNKISWLENGVSWYNTGNSQLQFNSSMPYLYVALG